VRVLVEDDVELVLHHALVEPRAAEDQPPQPMHERALGGSDELRPAVVDVLAEGGRGVGHLAVDDEVDEILGLLLLKPPADEADLARRLLAALGEVALVEGEAQLAVFEDEVVTGAVVSALADHGGEASVRRGRRHHMRGSSNSA
jgi:hypothetical protein